MIHVYTGTGKGKTTAAIGLAIRAAGAGLNVYICQFAKKRPTAEERILRNIKNITLERFGQHNFISTPPGHKDKEIARAAFQRITKILKKECYQLIILDEINIILSLKIVTPEEILRIIKPYCKKTEFIFTGRNAPSKIVKNADLVSEITEIKHYFNKGTKARRGIEF